MASNLIGDGLQWVSVFSQELLWLRFHMRFHDTEGPRLVPWSGSVASPPTVGFCQVLEGLRGLEALVGEHPALEVKHVSCRWRCGRRSHRLHHGCSRSLQVAANELEDARRGDRSESKPQILQVEPCIRTPKRVVISQGWLNTVAAQAVSDAGSWSGGSASGAAVEDAVGEPFWVVEPRLYFSLDRELYKIKTLRKRL